MPIPVLMSMTKPNTASFHEPVMSTMTMAAKMMPLNRVKTLARTMSASEREVEDLTALVCPLSVRAATSAAVSPFSPVSGMDWLSLMLPAYRLGFHTYGVFV